MDNSSILSWVCSLPEEASKHDNSLYSDATRKPKIAPRKRKIASTSLPEAVQHDNLLPSDAIRERKRKRKVASSSCLASPPFSSDTMASAPKRPRTEESVDATVDLETTPQRAVHSFAGPSTSPDLPRSSERATFRSSERATFRTSSASRKSSKEQLMGLSLSDTVVYTELLPRTAPVAAKKLYTILENIAKMKNILPHSFQQNIAQQQAITQQRISGLQGSITQRQTVVRMEMLQNNIEGYEELKSYCGPESAPNGNLPGRIPSLDEVDEVVRKAFQFRSNHENESRWNGAVNFRLLDMIFEDPISGQCSEFGATDCTTAQLHREFRPLASPAKMIDGCVFASFEDDEEWTPTMKKFALANPTLTVNYTNFEPLQLRPLVLSIEVKKPAVELEKAKLQIGIWHATHWSFLEWAIGRNFLHKRLYQGLGEPTTAQDEKDVKNQTFAALSALGVLPGIIISGNRWLILFSTYDQNRKTTVFNTDTAFGTTSTIYGAYAIIAGVRELAAWGRDVYLPWFREYVLLLD